MRTIVIAVVALLLSAFVALNWPAINTPTDVSLGVMVVRAPLGLLMLCALVIVILAALVHMAWWQARILSETRRHAKELQAQRVLADHAEASRFTELRAAMEAEMLRLAEHVTASEVAVRGELQENTNSLAAMLGEMDDRLKQNP